jgi:hypothetical protein
MDGLDTLGAENPDYVGFDYGVLFKTAGGLLEGGAGMLEAQQAEKASAADTKTKLEAVIAADMDASNAAARADVSAQLKSKTAAGDASAAKKAAAVQDQAGAGLPPEAVKQRTAAAEKMLATVSKNAKAKPKDGYQKALVKSWTATVKKIQTSGSGPDSMVKDEAQQESWMTRRVVGPLPGYAVVVGGLGLAGVLGLVVRKLVSR